MKQSVSEQNTLNKISNDRLGRWKTYAAVLFVYELALWVFLPRLPQTMLGQRTLCFVMGNAIALAGWIGYMAGTGHADGPVELQLRELLAFSKELRAAGMSEYRDSQAEPQPMMEPLDGAVPGMENF